MPGDQAAGAASGAGVIHDLGYRRYDGPRQRRPRIVAALAWYSFRGSFGFGRGARAKVLPAIALVVLCLPAAVNASAVASGGPRLFSYDTYVPVLRILVMTLFTAAQGPELVSRDLRGHVLPLYFSRPIKTADYPLAKYLAFTAACLVMVDVPLLLLYTGTIVSSHGGAAVWAQTRALIPGLLLGLLWSVVLAAVSLFLASLTGRRAFATGAVAIFFLLTFALSQILLSAENNAAGRVGPPGLAEKVSGLFSPFTLIEGVRQWLGGTRPDISVSDPGGFGAVYALVLLAFTGLCLAGLVARYRKVRLS